MLPRPVILPVGLSGLLYGLFTWGSLSLGWWLAGLIITLAITGLVFRLPAISLDWITHRYEVESFSIPSKLLVFTGQLIAVLAINRPLISGLSLGLSLVWILFVAKIPGRYYLSVLRRPLIFLALSAIVFLFHRTGEPQGLIQLPWGKDFLVVTQQTRALTAIIFLKVFACYQVLLSLIMTSPIRRIMHQLTGFGFPKILSEMMYLIYRNIHLLGTILSQAQASATLRLGYDGYTRSLHTMGLIGSRLLAQGVSLSRLHYDALEGRLFQDEIRLLEVKKSQVKDLWLYLAGGIFLLMGVFYAISY